MFFFLLHLFGGGGGGMQVKWNIKICDPKCYYFSWHFPTKNGTTAFTYLQLMCSSQFVNWSQSTYLLFWSSNERIWHEPCDDANWPRRRGAAPPHGATSHPSGGQIGNQGTLHFCWGGGGGGGGEKINVLQNILVSSNSTLKFNQNPFKICFDCQIWFRMTLCTNKRNLHYFYYVWRKCHKWVYKIQQKTKIDKIWHNQIPNIIN